jgi:hypothetical protein
MPKLFGFKFEEGDNKQDNAVVSPIPQNDEDKSDYYVSSGFYGQYVDIEGVYKTENDLIKRYREMALHPECDSAIEDIVDEAIVSDLHDSPVEIELSNVPGSEKLKQAIRLEFKYIKEIMDFDKKAHEIFRNWYVDGKLYYHKVIDVKNPSEGLKEVRYIDPMKIKLIRKLKNDNRNPNKFKEAIINSVNKKDGSDVNNAEIEEYYLYTPAPSGSSAAGNDFRSTSKPVKFSADSITYCTSGLVDRNKQTVLSYLHKAIKSLNQLRMIEDALVIYRLSRAPERRIFYIDVGNLPKIKAEQYLRDVMNRYRNKLVYNADTGEVKDDRKHMSMLEDFWLPRREGGRGTEITTLPGGQNLGELADIEYFQKKLFRSLNVPETRTSGSSGFSLGRSSEILRDEVRFTKFVGRLRKRFTSVFNDMLKTQLILKNVITPEDWKILSDHIQYDFLYDNHFSELKATEILNDKIAAVGAIEPYLGRYYSAQYVRTKILKQTDAQIIEIDEQIKKEIADGIIQDPKLLNQQIEPELGAQQEPSSGDLGKQVMEPDAGNVGEI